MTLTRTKIRIVRTLEGLLLLLCFLGAVTLTHMYTTGRTDDVWFIALAGGQTAVLACIVYTRIVVRKWLLFAVAKNNVARRAEFVSLYERSPIAYVTVHTDGAVESFNQAAVHLLQGTADTFGQVNFFSRIVLSEDSDISVLQEKVRAGMTINDQETLLQTAAGENIWVLISVHEHSDPRLRLISLVDVTEQKAIDTAKSEFVALATHQLRTPISAIRWNVELLEKKIKKNEIEKSDKYLKKINRNVHRMIALINDFLSVSKLEMGTFATTPEEIDLTVFFSSILDEYEESMLQKAITMERSDEPKNTILHTDSRLLHIILSNLLSNAVKYTPAGGKIIFSYESSGDKVLFTVADTGIGVPASEVETLFTKFFRASNAQAHQTEGTGLGLYVVQQSVEKLGGTIHVNSVENEGTHFSVLIPFGT